MLDLRQIIWKWEDQITKAHLSRCSLHPSYKGLRKPTTKKDCGCYFIWLWCELERESQRINQRIIDTEKKRGGFFGIHTSV